MCLLLLQVCVGVAAEWLYNLTTPLVVESDNSGGYEYI